MKNANDSIKRHRNEPSRLAETQTKTTTTTKKSTTRSLEKTDQILEWKKKERKSNTKIDDSVTAVIEEMPLQSTTIISSC